MAQNYAIIPPNLLVHFLSALLGFISVLVSGFVCLFFLLYNVAMGIPLFELSKVKEKSIAHITTNGSHWFSYIVHKLNHQLNRNIPDTGVYNSFRQRMCCLHKALKFPKGHITQDGCFFLPDFLSITQGWGQSIPERTLW